MSENNKHIGVFDSGLGGLTVLKALQKQLPDESFIYFGDTGHLPYGNKSKESVVAYSMKILKFLYEKQIKAAVVACNTASAVALQALQSEYSIPILNVIDPSIHSAINYSKSQTIGVIGTETTILSNTYQTKMKNINPNIKVVAQSCPLFVPIIEEGLMNKKFAHDIVQFYLKTFQDTEVDTLILGCTHYPLFKHIIKKNLHKHIKIIDSAKATAQQASECLENNQLLLSTKKNLKNQYYVSDKPHAFNHLAKVLLNLNNIQINHICL